jgi:hypothetical protein
MTKHPTTQPSGRIAELATILEWEGQLDNARIRELFGVQKVWASRLLAELIEWLGIRGKRPQKHGPVFLSKPITEKQASPAEYLRLLSASPGGLGADPLVHDARIDLTSVSPATFAAIREAAQRRVGLRLSYRSMSSPDGSSRLVFPHAIVCAPRRWHMRAWCANRQDFRDFVLARVQHAELDETIAPHTAADDTAWNHLVDLVLVPHPALTPAQQALIAAEYFPGAHAKRLRVREALAGYTLQDLHVAIDAEKQRPPEYQLLLASNSASRGFKLDA